MAGLGPAPKDPAQRVRRAKPARADWRDLDAVDKRRAYLPPLPELRADSEPWLQSTRETWSRYQLDPVTRTYSPGDIEAALRLIGMIDRMSRGEAKWATEIRHTETLLGLNPKGKRDLRLRVPQADADEDAPRGELVGIDGGKISAREQALGLIPEVRPPTAD